MANREVVKFNGKPAEVELGYATGKEGQNDNGPFYTYTLAGDKVMFASPTLNQIIQGMQPYKGMRLAIQLMAGNKWDVRRVDPPAEQPGNFARNPAAQQAGETYNGHANGTTPTPAPASLMTGQGQSRLQYFTAAVDLAIATKHYAHLSGLSLDIKFEDVRAIANSWCIDASKGGR